MPITIQSDCAHREFNSVEHLKHAWIQDKDIWQCLNHLVNVWTILYMYCTIWLNRQNVSEMWKLLLIFPLSWWALGLGVFLNWPNIWMKDRMILTGSKIFAKMFLWFKTDFGFFRLFFRPSSYPANGWSWHKKKMYNHVEFWWENGVGSSCQFEEDLAAGIPLERREVLQSPWIPKNDLNTC